MTDSPLNPAAVEALVTEWFRKLTDHAPMVEMMDMLSPYGLAMTFPDTEVLGFAGFERWYQTVIRLFFDQVHEVRSVRTEISDGVATVAIAVHWEASTWSPPAGYSARIRANADQTWTVVLSEAGRPVIRRYTVNSLTYEDGSAR